MLRIVKPATVLAWQRKGFRLFWTWRVRRGNPGRPTIPPEIRDLIRLLSRNNPRWGAPRIHGELLKLGIDITEPIVAKYMVRHRKPPSQTWRTFLDNHVRNMVSIDFFTVPTIRFQILYVFGAGPRPPAHSPLRGDLTSHRGVDRPTATRSFAVGQCATLPNARPRQDLWQGVRERSLHRFLLLYAAYYHRWRAHLALDKDTPEARRTQPPTDGPVVEFRELGGLHRHYERRAA